MAEHETYLNIIAPRNDFDDPEHPAHLLSKENSSRRQQVLSPDEQVFWHGQPPDQIILATGSYRKALMFQLQLSGVQFPGFDGYLTQTRVHGQAVLDFQTYLHQTIPNGDAHSRPKQLLGYYHGVPVYMESAGGETSSNENPTQEAANKATALGSKYSGKNVLVLSTDTVDHPERVIATQDGYVVDTTKPPIPKLGKPMNSPDFPRMSWTAQQLVEAQEFFDQTINSFLTESEQSDHAQVIADARPKQNLNGDQLATSERAYLELDKLLYFAELTRITHSNGVALLNCLTSEVVTSPTCEAVLQFVLDGRSRDLGLRANLGLGLSKDVGGGGALQSELNWDNVWGLVSNLPQTDALTALVQMLGYENFESYVTSHDQGKLDTNRELQMMWALYCQIAGSPFAMLDMILKNYSQNQMEGR